MVPAATVLEVGEGPTQPAQPASKHRAWGAVDGRRLDSDPRGGYPNAPRGWRRKHTVTAPLNTGVDSALQPDSPAERFARQRRRNWARLLKKIYEVDPLTCPRCGNRMQIIAFIEEWGVIRKILQHLGLWEQPQRAPPPPSLLPHKLEAFLATLSPHQRQQVRASTDSVFWDDVPVYRG